MLSETRNKQKEKFKPTDQVKRLRQHIQTILHCPAEVVLKEFIVYKDYICGPMESQHNHQILLKNLKNYPNAEIEHVIA